MTAPDRRVGLLTELAVAAFSLLISIGWAVILSMSQRNRKKVRSLPRADGTCTLEDRVSVVIPVRNGEGIIGQTLNSVTAQEGVKCEVIVVDDRSSDGTATATARFIGKGVVYVLARERPEGWMGKSWACHEGYLTSSGDWLVFMDADSQLQEEGLLMDALCFARSEGMSAMSLMPRLRTDSIASKVMLPALYALLYVLAPPYKTTDPSSDLAFFFGAFIAVKRSAYEEVGGHHAIRDKLLDDKSLGELIKSSGHRVALLDASDRFSATFAGSFRGHVNGLQRLFTQYAVESVQERGVLGGLLFMTRYLAAAVLAMIPPVALPIVAIALDLPLYVKLLSLLPVLTVITGHHRISASVGIRGVYSLTIPLAHLTILSVLLYVAARSLSGKLVLKWHGRKYVYELRRGRGKSLLAG
ncbi:MAG: glycosyltransferase family 2 protein [Nitrososphaerota archaeon]|nr:glycosyltransferase family 2 protein [Nitrososphaerota archaeon]